MAAATTIIAGAGLAMGAGQTASGIFGKAKAKKALDNLETPELDNAFEDIQISTEGSDLIREESQRTSASLIDNAKAGGVRSVMASIPMISAQNTMINREGRKYLDDQINDKSYAIAQDDSRIRQMAENRYLGEVAGYGQAMQASRQDIWSGVRGMGSSLMYGARNGMLEGGGYDGTEYFADELEKMQ